MPINLSPSNSDSRVFKVAAVQAEPVWLDLQGSVEKTIGLIKQASSAGAKVIGFPELWIPGYPWTIWAQGPLECLPVLKEYSANALAVHSPEMDRIRQAVKEAAATVVLGFAERDGASLYISQVTIRSNGEIANHRQKIKATGYEKVVFGDGAGRPLTLLKESTTSYRPSGVALEAFVVGSISSMQPFLKCHMYAQHPQMFVGSWPPAFKPNQGGAPYSISGEGCSRMSQVVAIEGGCYGIISTQVVSQAGAEKLKIAGFPWVTVPGGGFACIFAPDGTQITKPTDPAEETIVYADISLDVISEVKLIGDIVGNYSRPDLFHIVARGENLNHVTYDGQDEDEAERHRRNTDNLSSSKTFS
ncbi:hypothetical protein ONZ45_g1259 [Pleurotus djamor]|nr:hypothetical protein ONZ45_g1259 [Pleurotus djamor]